MPAVLSLKSVRIRHGARVALDGFSLELDRGEIVALLGPNGSGKSTSLLLAAGVLEASEGVVKVEGIRRSDNPAEYAARVGLVPQDCALYEDLTVVANLRFFGKIHGLGGSQLRSCVESVLARFELGDRAGSRVRDLSGGMKQRVNLAAALLHNPPLLLLDEPTAGLDTPTREAFFADLTRLRDEGHTILFSTHYFDEAAQAADRVAVLEEGRLIALGRSAELLRGISPKATVYAYIRNRIPRFLVRSLIQRLPPEVEVEITGNRLRIVAATGCALGRALALILAEGVELDNIHSPSGKSSAQVTRGVTSEVASMPGLGRDKP